MYLSLNFPRFLCEEVITFCADGFHDQPPFWIPACVFSHVDVTDEGLSCFSSQGVNHLWLKGLNGAPPPQLIPTATDTVSSSIFVESLSCKCGHLLLTIS